MPAHALCGLRASVFAAAVKQSVAGRRSTCLDATFKHMPALRSAHSQNLRADQQCAVRDCVHLPLQVPCHPAVMRKVSAQCAPCSATLQTPAQSC